jgi:hypothetical protein
MIAALVAVMSAVAEATMIAATVVAATMTMAAE